MNGERIGGGGAGLASRHNNQPVGARQYKSTVRADAQAGRRRRKEKEEEKEEMEKSDFSSYWYFVS